MKDAILHLHSSLSPPATCDKNQSREPIDGIFVTSGLHISRGGYGALYEGCPSDHRYLWIDIPHHDALGYEPPPLVSPKIQRLNCRHQHMVDRYNKAVTKALTSEKLYAALLHVKSCALANGWSQDLEDSYNHINDRQYAIRKDVEDNIRHIRAGGVPWSPRLQGFRTDIEIWTMLLKKRKGRKASNRKIRRLLRKTCIRGAYTLTIQELEEKVTEAHQAYKTAKATAGDWRDEFLTSLAAARAKRNGTTVEKELKQLRLIELQKRTARNIKRMRRKLGQNATTKVYVTEDGVRRVATDKEDIEDVAINENQSRFSQSEVTPPMTEPLVSALGYLGDTPAGDAILDGTYEFPPGTDYYAKLLLRQLQMPANARAHPLPIYTIDSNDQRRAWKRQKEGVSSDPDGLSFSHFKCSIEDDTLCDFDATLRDLPYRYGFSPEHWQQITDVEILKKAGVYDIELMRTITLMDSAFNMNNKKLGRELMAHAEALGNLPREQYGSRKSHQSVMAALNKVLTMDLVRQRRIAAALCSNDAKSCYDRVVHSIAALAARYQGCPKGPIHSMLKTLQRSDHCIRTGFGRSTRRFGKNRQVPLQGLGQGNGFAPSGWAFVSTPLINMMRAAGFGLNLLTCLSLSLVSFVCYAFVDDTDIVHCASNVDVPGTQVLQDMRRMATHWVGGLRATGGALRVDKSYWYLIDFIWRNNRWHYASCADVPGDIYVQHADGPNMLLPRLEPHEAKETLGIFISMDGNHVAEVDKLRAKADEFAECIRTGFVSKDEAWHALNSTIMKTLEYPMEAISLTKAQWDFILKPILFATLPRSGIVRTFPRTSLFGPAEFSGFGVMHPYHKQFLKHLSVCLRESSSPTITGDLLRATLEQLRLDSGLPGHHGDWFLPYVQTSLTPCWLLDTLLYCDENDLTLQDTCPALSPLTSDDFFLMRSFISNGYSPGELRILNDCRKFLHAVTLSDLITADRRFLSYGSYHGTSTCCRRSIQWPRQPPSLPASHWNLWKKALTKCFLVASSPHRRLAVSLGSWLPSVFSSWPWLYSPSEHRLYHREGPLWKLWQSTSPSRRRGSSARFRRSAIVSDLPPTDALLASVSFPNHATALLSGTSPPPPTPPPAEMEYTSMSLQDILASSDPLDTWSVETFHSPDDGHSLAQAIIQGTATAISDGSYKEDLHLGTSAFLLRGVNRTLSVLGANAVPGSPCDQSAYRSELAGTSGSLAIISAVCKKYDIHEGSITIGLDGEQAMLNASSSRPLSASCPAFDLLTDIRAKAALLPITVRWQWIEGHQDKHIAFSDLSPLSQDNVIVDGVAKDFLNQVAASGFVPSPQRFGHESWSISLRGIKLSRIDFSSLYLDLTASACTQRWARKHDITIPAVLSIDWDICGDAIRSLPFCQQRRIIKHTNGHFGVASKLEEWKLQDHSECPRCQRVESPKHVIVCPKAKPTWLTSLLKFETWLHSKRTNPQLIHAVLTHLRCWHDATPFPDSTSITDRALRRAIRSQARIGWYPFLMGHISTHWRAVQHDYYVWLGRRNTGRQWAKQLIVKLFDISWDLWEHRNGILHNTITPAKQRLIDSVDVQLREEHNAGASNVLPRDRPLFLPSLDTLLAYELPDKQKWVASVLAARSRWRRRRELRLASLSDQRSLFRRWLRRPLTSPPRPLDNLTSPRAAVPSRKPHTPIKKPPIIRAKRRSKMNRVSTKRSSQYSTRSIITYLNNTQKPTKKE